MDFPIADPVAAYAEAWKRTCALLGRVESSSDLMEIYFKLEELRVVYGDPNKEVPLGTMTFKSKGK
jgi:hypothetical protein